MSRVLPSRFARAMHWEFWPTWAVYLPLVPWFALQAARYRSASLPLIANGFEPLARIAGESKYDILRLLPEAWKPRDAIIPAGLQHQREDALAVLLAREGFKFPLILKPDQGCRGQGVRLVHNLAAASAALAVHKGATLVQAYHAGPGECGVLYAREPGAARGSILGITGKRFPVVVGDGQSTLRQLILRDARLRLQHDRFLARLGAKQTTIPSEGERISLGIAGNHCQGTMFFDATSLATDALRARCDWLADHVPGLCYGRFDVRFADEDAFAAGEEFSVVELNGLASEPTHAYDPALSLASSYREFARAIATLYRLGALRRAAGAQDPGWLAGWKALRESAAFETSDELAD